MINILNNNNNQNNIINNPSCTSNNSNIFFQNVCSSNVDNKKEEKKQLKFNQTRCSRCMHGHNCKYGLNCIYHHTKYENMWFAKRESVTRDLYNLKKMLNLEEFNFDNIISEYYNSEDFYNDITKHIDLLINNDEDLLNNSFNWFNITFSDHRFNQNFVIYRYMTSNEINIKQISKDDIKKILKIKKKEEVDDNICCICHDEITDIEKNNELITKNNNIYNLICCNKYSYHYECIEKWLLSNPSCPFCRKDYSK